MLPRVYLVRHGETEWSLSGQHTGRTDIPLTDEGERKARGLRERLKGLKFDRVFTSPLQRAARTCQLAGFGDHAKLDSDLLEWNYGDYEGRKSSEILSRTARLAPVSRRVPEWRAAGRCRRPRRSCHQPPSRGRRSSHRVFQRAYPQGVGGPLARPCAVGRAPLHARHGKRQHPRLRTRQKRAGALVVELGLKPIRRRTADIRRKRQFIAENRNQG